MGEYRWVFAHVGFFCFWWCGTSVTKRGNPFFSIIQPIRLDYVGDACLSLPRVLGARGIETTLHSALAEEEHQAIKHSARILREAVSTIAYK